MAYGHDQIYIEEKKCTGCGKCKAACIKSPESLLNRKHGKKVCVCMKYAITLEN
jgi:ferredoxin